MGREPQRSALAFLGSVGKFRLVWLYPGKRDVPEYTKVM